MDQRQGAIGDATFNADGTGIHKWGNISSPGVWKIAGNTHCIKWETVMGGREFCNNWYGVGKKEYKMIRADGSLDSTVKLK